MKEMELIDHEITEEILEVQEIQKGYKKRKKYIIEMKKNTYFVKVLPYKICEEEIKKTKWIYHIYESVNIPVVPLYDIVIKGEQTIFIYPYFEGSDLKDSNLSLKEYEKYGRKVATEVKKMNGIKQYPDSFRGFDLKKHCDDYVTRLWKVNATMNEKMCKLFDPSFLNHFVLRFQRLCDEIINHDVMLNHNDIKTANIMKDSVGDFYFVDIEPIDLTFPGFNIHYSIYHFLLEDDSSKQECSFLKGFVQEYDPDQLLIQEFEYFLISDFINELEKLLLEKWEYLENHISFIKKMLFNEDQILNQMLYDSLIK